MGLYDTMPKLRLVYFFDIVYVADLGTIFFESFWKNGLCMVKSFQMQLLSFKPQRIWKF